MKTWQNWFTAAVLTIKATNCLCWQCGQQFNVHPHSSQHEIRSAPCIRKRVVLLDKQGQLLMQTAIHRLQHSCVHVTAYVIWMAVQLCRTYRHTSINDSLRNWCEQDEQVFIDFMYYYWTWLCSHCSCACRICLTVHYANQLIQPLCFLEFLFLFHFK